MSDTTADVQQNSDGIAWLDGRYHADLEPAAERAIRAAGLAWHNETEAQRQLALAASIAPDHMAVLIAHYRYSLYKHYYAPAEAYAARILVALAHRVGIAADWQQVGPGAADFGSDNPDIRSWLFVLQAYGYVLLRLGRREQAMAALHRIVTLDAADQTKTRTLLRVIERAGKDD